MLENVVIVLVVAVLLVAYIITSRTAKRTAALLAKASKEVLDLVEDVKVANKELDALRAEHEREKALARKLAEEKANADRRKTERRNSPNGERTDRRDPSCRGRRRDD